MVENEVRVPRWAMWVKKETAFLSRKYICPQSHEERMVKPISLSIGWRPYMEPQALEEIVTASLKRLISTKNTLWLLVEDGGFVYLFVSEQHIAPINNMLLVWASLINRQGCNHRCQEKGIPHGRGLLGRKGRGRGKMGEAEKETTASPGKKSISRDNQCYTFRGGGISYLLLWN